MNRSLRFIFHGAPRYRACLAAVLLALASPAFGAPGSTAVTTTPAISPTDLQFFETKIRPLLVDKCYQCHSREADKVRGGLLLDSREAVLHGGNTGPAITPGKVDDSLLIQAIRYKDEDLQMPPEKSGGKLTDAQIADLTEWVRRGAPDPRTLVAKGSSPSYGGVGRAHWAFQPVKKPAVPTVENAAWCRNPIDNFLLAKLETNGLRPNEAADKWTLIRRVYFDMIGLPPSLREVQAFLNDHSPEAYEKIVDRLLASPFYGEHWARYWLDVARYSDTKGDPPRQDDLRYPHAWTYRDYVIGAFNGDLPYNQFILEQLAGDRVQAAVDKKTKDKTGKIPEDRRAMAALGFLTLGNAFDGRRDDIIADQIDVTTKAFLGLTVACARCHDHKFDPIPTKDYYSLYGVFMNSQPPPAMPTLERDPAKSPEHLEYVAKADALQKREDAIKAEFLENRRSRQKDPAKRREIVRKEREVKSQIADLESTHPGAPARVNALYDVPRTRDYPVLLRGEAANKGDVAPRRFLEILSADPKKRPEWRNGSGRAELAFAIADPKNPLTARVIVNRIWQQHWGAGFVATPDDLGNMSSPPSHPELLDFLAAEFVENNWSLKKLHRSILLSAAYQQSSKNNPEYAELDPNNKLLWRYNLRRMDFEQMHDSLLAITGELDTTMGGRPVAITSGEFAKRRAIYTLIDRRNPPELLTQFDFPSPDVSSGRRYETIVPQQALFLMNSPMVIEAARKLVERPFFGTLPTDADRVTALYLAIYQRMPTPKEIELGAGYVKANPSGAGLEIPEVAKTASAPSRDAKKNERQAMAQKRAQGKFSTQVGGVYEKRAPLDAWTKLAHAIFQSNEAIFYR
ncbi:MAG: hypothetical protein RIQ93_964 [Verrucomicrobiota bacterium]|jgi:hypothetical protein